ncbi:cytochrome c oxidase subunit 8A, mitochondrial-like [Sturnira hondurensis]|uniref:cytochrome c oxidase subunit 8A, mitochondrial-like n=1 Tax=Sturnira hondurensis TaxID=192404 RepID=UPI00187B108D|nr:cytochrome c oxidase subunit 8A, mitochondrial-like [Sturnira hondurensis]
MSALTPLLLRGLMGPAWRLLVPHAQVHSKPLGEQIGTMDLTIGLTCCFLCILLPADWVLSHLESYKKQEGRGCPLPHPGTRPPRPSCWCLLHSRSAPLVPVLWLQ